MVFALTAKGDTKEARKVAEDALRSFAASGDAQGQLSAHNALVHVYLELKNCPEGTKMGPREA